PGTDVPSIFGAGGLDYCVRDGNRYDPTAPRTENSILARGREASTRWCCSGRVLDVGRAPGRRLERRGEVRGHLVDLSVAELDQRDDLPCLAVRIGDLPGRREPIACACDDRRLGGRAGRARLARHSSGIVLDDRAPIVFPAEALAGLRVLLDDVVGKQPLLGFDVVRPHGLQELLDGRAVVCHLVSSPLARHASAVPPGSVPLMKNGMPATGRCFGSVGRRYRGRRLASASASARTWHSLRSTGRRRRLAERCHSRSALLW